MSKSWVDWAHGFPFGIFGHHCTPRTGANRKEWWEPHQQNHCGGFTHTTTTTTTTRKKTHDHTICMLHPPKKNSSSPFWKFSKNGEQTGLASRCRRLDVKSLNSTPPEDQHGNQSKSWLKKKRGGISSSSGLKFRFHVKLWGVG